MWLYSIIISIFIIEHFNLSQADTKLSFFSWLDYLSNNADKANM